jgi:hypothetical protein
VQRDVPGVRPDLQPRHAVLPRLYEGRLKRQGAARRPGEHRRQVLVGERVHLGHGAQDPIHRRDIDPGPLPHERSIAPAEAMDMEIGLRRAADRVAVACFKRGGEVDGHPVT